MIKTVIYARYSSERQNEQSIEGQIHECQAYAQRHDMTIVDTYIDRAMSGMADNRPEFQRMIADSKSGAFDAVLCYKMDRFARNRMDSVMYKSILHRNGIKIFYAMENIPDGPEGIILESLLEGMAEYYSAELSQKIMRGLKESAGKGFFCGGRVPYGYKIENKKYVVDERTAPYVRKIFSDYISGKPLVEIMKWLDNEPNYAGRGKPWIKTSLSRIFTNKKYIGIYEKYGITNSIPAIIDEDTFTAAASRKQRNNHINNYKNRRNFLLTGKSFCHCGAMLTGTSGKNKIGRNYYYYKCSQKCGQKNIQAKQLEELVIDTTINDIFNPANFDSIADSCMRYLAKQKKQPSKIDSLKKQLDDTNKKITNIMSAIERGIFSDTVDERLKSLEKTKYDLTIAIHQEMATANELELDRDKILFMLEHFRDMVYSADGNRQLIIDNFVREVRLGTDGNIYVSYQFPHSTSTVSTESSMSISDVIQQFRSGSVRLAKRFVHQMSFHPNSTGFI